MWYSTGTSASSVGPAYLRALLEARRLAELGIAAIPHGHPEESYQGMLEGKQPPSKATLLSRSGHQKRASMTKTIFENDGCMVSVAPKMKTKFKLQLDLVAGGSSLDFRVGIAPSCQVGRCAIA